MCEYCDCKDVINTFEDDGYFISFNFNGIV